jgi:hypothetical protein
MAHKKLLTEAEIRRFMKLATIGDVGESKIQEMGYTHPGGRIQEEDEESELHATEDELGAEDRFADEEGDELADLEEPMPEEEPVGGEEDMGGMEMGEREELLAQVVDAVAGVLGVEADVEGVEGEEEELGEPEEMDMDMDVEMDAEEGGEEVPAELEVGAEEEEIGMRDYQESIVNEVSKRVAARLVKADRREKMAKQLTERIFARLTKK